MGLDRDIIILAWLNRQPAGFALAEDIKFIATPADLQSLADRGLILRVPSREPDGEGGYVLTPEGRDHQEGD